MLRIYFQFIPTSVLNCLLHVWVGWVTTNHCFQLRDIDFDFISYCCFVSQIIALCSHGRGWMANVIDFDGTSWRWMNLWLLTNSLQNGDYQKKTASWLLSWWLYILDIARCWKMDVVKFLPPPKSMSSPPSVLWEQFDGGPNPNKRMHRTYSNLVDNGINLDKLIEYLSFRFV